LEAGQIAAAGDILGSYLFLVRGLDMASTCLILTLQCPYYSCFLGNNSERLQGVNVYRISDQVHLGWSLLGIPLDFGSLSAT